MDIERLSHFIAVAKHLNFTKAASECHIAQTAMSRHIVALEDELGVTLLNRNSKKVTLTPAGELFYKEAQAIIGNLEMAIQRTRLKAEGYAGMIKIGFGPYEQTLVTNSVIRFAQSYPDVEVLYEQYNFKTLVEKLKQGLVDVAFSISDCPQQVEGASYVQICDTELKLILDWSHPMSNKSEVTLEDLSSLEFVYHSEIGGPYPPMHFLETCAMFGFQPKHLVSTNSLAAKLVTVLACKKAALVPSFLVNSFRSEYCVLSMPKPNRPLSPYCASYLEDNPNQIVKEFMQLLQ